METKWLLLPLLFVLHCAFSSCAAAGQRPVRSALSPSDLIDSYEAVKPTIIHYSMETTQGIPHELSIGIKLSDNDFIIHLILNRGLLPRHYVETHFDESNNVITSKTRKNCFYHGTVEGHPDWLVSMSTCAGLRGTFGDHGDYSRLYHIEPIDKDSDAIEQPCMVFTASQLSTEKMSGTCGVSAKHNHFNRNISISAPGTRLRRQTATMIVEWVIANDQRQYNNLGSNITRTALRSIEIANHVDMLFAKIDIRIALVGVQTWTTGDQITVVSDPNTLLTNFKVYRETLLSAYRNHDSSMLITGIDLDGSTVGIAALGTMCSATSSAGLSQDSGSSIAAVGSTAAHELGHIFNMDHDDERACTCSAGDGECIMAAVSSSASPPDEWSSCSVSDLNAGFTNDNLDRCLSNEPNTIFGDPVCGNGIREGDEICDCGSRALCNDPCCDADTCQLVSGAACSNQKACCSNCQIAASGTICRSASNECDLREVCTGTSAECPADAALMNGSPCAGGQAYCFEGACRDPNALCRENFLQVSGTTSLPSSAPSTCYDFNVDGDNFGNCGQSSTDFISCESADTLCGQLHCVDAGNFSGSSTGLVLLQTRTVRVQLNLISCRSFTSPIGSDVQLGLVEDGTRCGDNLICLNQRCIPLSSVVNNNNTTTCPVTNSLECSGNGICNSLNLCSCNDGFTGADCSRGGQGSINGLQSTVLLVLIISAVAVLL